MVHKKIGSIIFFLTGCIVQQVYSAYAPNISLDLFDDYNRSCREAHVGTHYRLEARVQGATKGQGWPQVAGLCADWVAGRQQQQEISWSQGKKTESIRFIWDVIFNASGVITLGPASYVDDTGKTIVSPVLSIAVHEKAAHAAASTKTSSSTFIRWEIERLDPFVGETIPVRLVFYTTDSTTQLEAISEINLQGAHLELTREPKWASAVHNGISYKTATWSGILSIENAGIMYMPCITISYRIGSTSRSSSPWAMMHHMLNSFSPLYHKRSAELSLHVRALPNFKHPIIGVGIINTATREVSDGAMRCGEAGTIIYRLQGSIHPTRLQLPILEGPADVAKMYSSTYTHEGEYPYYKYVQEYVIHPQKVGPVKFDEQLLWYFNPVKEAYESCVISPFEIDVLINPSINASVQSLPSSQEPVVEAPQLDNVDEKNLSPVLPKKQFPKPVLPLKWFLLCLFLPCVLVFSKRVFSARAARMYHAIKIYWIRRVALRKINSAAQQGNGYMLLQTMRYVLHNIFTISNDASEGDCIVACLIDRGMEQESINNWKKLWIDLHKAAFGKMLSPEEYESLRCDCREWISKL